MLPAEVRHLILEKNEQHQYPVLLRTPPVDHPGAAPSAPATAGPAQLPDTSTARNDLPEFGRGDQLSLKQSVLLFIEDDNVNALIQMSDGRWSSRRVATWPWPRSAKLTVSVSSIKSAITRRNLVHPQWGAAPAAEFPQATPRGRRETLRTIHPHTFGISCGAKRRRLHAVVMRRSAP